MKHGSLFSGIGGFDLAAEWAGYTNVFQVELNEYCKQVLKKNFANANIFGDIKQFDGRPFRGSIDVISGGFPCQPFSSAGKRLGTADNRHLWPQMLRVIREISPRWVVCENVFGLVNWSEGFVFEDVQADLEAAGYEVQAFVLPAASVGAPHRRYRVWIVAHCSGEQMGAAGQSWEYSKMGENVTANPNNQRRKEHIPSEEPSRPGRLGGRMLTQWANWPTESPVCGRNDGISRRVDRIAALGNAVVPQVVYYIFEAINEYNKLYC